MAGCSYKERSKIKKECPLCNSKSNPISYPAVKMVVKEDLKKWVVEDQYYTCDHQECDVVFFNHEGDQIYLVVDVDLGANFQEVTKDHSHSCGGSYKGGCGGCSREGH